jgi:transcriptional regulator with XRE-family HTH domain
MNKNLQSKYNQYFNKLTLRELADRTGYDQPRWSRYISGKTDPSLGILLESARKLNIPIPYFICAFLYRRKAHAKQKQRV